MLTWFFSKQRCWRSHLVRVYRPLWFTSWVIVLSLITRRKSFASSLDDKFSYGALSTSLEEASYNCGRNVELFWKCSEYDTAQFLKDYFFYRLLPWKVNFSNPYGRHTAHKTWMKKNLIMAPETTFWFFSCRKVKANGWKIGKRIFL